MEYYSAIKNDKIVPFVTTQMDLEGIILSERSQTEKDKIILFTTTWMNLEGIMLSKISQTEKDKHHMISLICEISTNLWTKRIN